MGSGPPSRSSGTGPGGGFDRRLLLRGALGAGAIAAVALPARRLLSPAAVAEPVSMIVNSATRDEPACIAPLTAPEPVQRSLFD